MRSVCSQHYLLHTTEPLISFDRYESLLSIVRRDTGPVEQAIALVRLLTCGHLCLLTSRPMEWQGGAIGQFSPAKRKVTEWTFPVTISAYAYSQSIQRILKLCHECSKHADVNQMSPKNLAIVFSPGTSAW